ncbi:RNA methyltransferase [Danxiaibacter flavus]|uniref:tRNA (guanosine(18)-2'-O)-methyltransferase n=1 Tax=Danxiaibacter flavus TaxID=3049108 RepID=A0ABV3ZAZ5_9BACT|nr:RNA methyltransferase [Chitinophagaceae bacterium DXS]
MTPERYNKLTKVLAKRQNNLTVVMENIEDPRNITAVMRTCDAVGIQDIYVINSKPKRNREWKFKSGTSAAKWLTLHQFDNVEECVAAVRKVFNKIYTTRLTAESVSIYDVDLTDKVALVFGNEQTGVSDEICNASDGNFLIPQMGLIQSLNISVACAVSVYEAFRQKTIAGHYTQPSLSQERMDQLQTLWQLKEQS